MTPSTMLHLFAVYISTMVENTHTHTHTLTHTFIKGMRKYLPELYDNNNTLNLSKS